MRVVSPHLLGLVRNRYPYAFASEGALVCILTTALCALGNVFTVRVMARFTQVCLIVQDAHASL